MQEHIIISKDRSVNVPESIRKIGVQYDHNVNTLTFDCPRYSAGGVDLSTLIFYVNYVLPDNTPGSSRLENVTVDTEDSELIHFDWVIRRAVTGQQGFLKCLVCAKKSDAEGTETNHWNTDLFNTMYVTEGLETEAEIEEENKDLITQLLLEMDTYDENLLDLSNRVGELSNLTTDNKSSVVAAVNEVKGETSELKGDLGVHNLVNTAELFEGYIHFTDGFVFTNVSGFHNTDFVEIGWLKKIKVKRTFHYGADGLVFYDKHKNYISGYAEQTGSNYVVLDVPENAVYIRLSGFSYETLEVYPNDVWKILNNHSNELLELKELKGGNILESQIKGTIISD